MKTQDFANELNANRTEHLAEWEEWLWKDGGLIPQAQHPPLPTKIHPTVIHLTVRSYFT